MAERLSAAERTLAAEVRAVELGAHARLADDGHSFLVRSESEPGVNRHVQVEAVGGVVAFICDCPYGNGQRKAVPCWHAATAARRLAREGFLVWRDGRWRPTEAAQRSLYGAVRPVTPEPVPTPLRISDEELWRMLGGES